MFYNLSFCESRRHALDDHLMVPSSVSTTASSSIDIFLRICKNARAACRREAKFGRNLHHYFKLLVPPASSHSMEMPCKG
jgi:hypothetical protein